MAMGISLEQFQRELENQLKQAQSDSRKFVTLASAEVERTAKTIMRDTVTNPNVTYGRKGHHPSVAGEPPAPDTGTMLQSVTHSVETEGLEPVGYVGSTLQNPPEPRYLEYGTSKMKPRPWLSTALIKSQSFMDNLFREIFGK